MKERTYRMLLKNGKGTPYHYTEALAMRADMKEIFMTKAQIKGEVAANASAGVEQVQPEPEPEVKPVRSNAGILAAQKRIAEIRAEKAAEKVQKAEISTQEDAPATEDAPDEVKKNESSEAPGQEPEKDGKK